MTAFTMAEQEQAFALLATALKAQVLPTEHGAHREAKAEEFMLMHRSPMGVYGFKHEDTRNYVFVNRYSGALRVPMTTEPFKRGYFDVY